MDEETLFKTVYIAQKLGRFQVSLTAGAKVAAAELATADADEWWNQLQEFRGMVSQFVEIEPRDAGGDCTILWCRTTIAHTHPRLRCERCGVEGLAENMTAERHKCKPDRIQQEPWSQQLQCGALVSREGVTFSCALDLGHLSDCAPGVFGDD